MKVVDRISISELTEMSTRMYDGLVKADIDIAKRKFIVDMEMHADGEDSLLRDGSKQEDLWGINLYPAKYGTDDFIEFDSMINLKPRQNNMTRSVEDPKIRSLIRDIVAEVVHE